MKNMFPSCFILICFSLQNSFLSGHNSKNLEAVVHIFSEAAARLLKTLKCFQKQPHNLHHKKISAAHFLSEVVAHYYILGAAARSLRNIEMDLGAATHLLKHKKYVQKQIWC